MFTMDNWRVHFEFRESQTSVSHAHWNGATGRERVKDFSPLLFQLNISPGRCFSLGKCTILLFLISGPYYTKLLTHLSKNPENMCCSKIKMEIMMHCHLSVGNCSPSYTMWPKYPCPPLLGLNGELAAIPC